MIGLLWERPVVRFLVAGAVAAGVNVLSRIILNHFLSYDLSIVGAFIIALTTGFALNRAMVFTAEGSIVGQYSRFALVNLLALAQVWLVSISLARWGLPALGFVQHAETAAHVIGVLSPVLTSYWAHRHFTFRTKSRIP
jgi:putative flippase GtrA